MMTRTVSTAEIAAVVCVPTFRRPDQLARTLDSLVAQRFAEPFAVVVVDNDGAGRAGAAVADQYFRDGRLVGRSLVETQQGNCFAINAVFGAALADYPAARFFLMIDDDEWAEPDWLAHMVGTAQATGVGIVGGPVHPWIGEGAPAMLARHPALCPAYETSGPVPLIYGSGNCLITRETFARLGLPAFDVAYNFLGGGDTDFFCRARAAGIRFHWVAEAVVNENVPMARTRLSWLAARALRIGAINYRIERKGAAGTAARIAVSARSLGVLAVSLMRGARLFLRTQEAAIAMHPPLVAAGRCLAAAGIEPKPYRATAPAVAAP